MSGLERKDCMGGCLQVTLALPPLAMGRGEGGDSKLKGLRGEAGGGGRGDLRTTLGQHRQTRSSVYGANPNPY